MRVYVTQNGVQEPRRYHGLKDVTVSTSADVTASSMPSASVEMTIETDDTIRAGALLFVEDEIADESTEATSGIGRRVSYAEVEEPHSVHVKTIGSTEVLDSAMLPAQMATEALAYAIVMEACLTAGIRFSASQLAYDRLNAQTAGYLPEQSARERILWMCLVTGTFVKSEDFGGIFIAAPDEAAKFIPEEDTFWRPRMAYRDYVTSIEVTSYSYEERMPSRTEEYVEVGEAVYVQTKSVTKIEVLGVPEGTPANPVVVDGITAISDRNVDSVLSRLADHHFGRVTASVDVMNDRWRYVAGDLVTALTGIGDETITGHVESVTYSYGLRTRSRLELSGVSIGRAGRVRIRFWLDRTQVGQRELRLPAGTGYEIPLRYLDISFEGHRRILRPRADVVSGTVPNDVVIHDVQVDVVLDYHDGDLLVAGVDGASAVEGTLAIS